MKNIRIIIILAVFLAVISMASVSASDMESLNVTANSPDESDSYLSDESVATIDNFTVTPSYGVEGQSVEIKPAATSNGAEIPGNVTFYSDIKYSEQIGMITTDGGSITLPLLKSNESTYCPFYYIFNGEYNGSKYYDKDYLYFVIMKENTIDMEYKFTDDGLTLTVTPAYYKANGTDSLLSVYINGEQKDTFDYNTFTYTLPYNSYDGQLEIYVKYKGYFDSKNGDYYAGCESKHITAYLSNSTVTVVNSTYGNVQLRVFVPLEGKYTLNVGKLNSYGPTSYSLTFDSPGEQTISLNNYDVGEYRAWISGNNSEALDFNITKAIPQITISSVGNNTNNTCEHNITLSAPGNGKFITNVTDGEYLSGQSITLNNLNIGQNTILITYMGSDNYNSTSKEIIFVVDKYQSTVSIEMNQTKVNAGDNIKITPYVYINGNLCENGTVVFYNESDSEIARIDLDQNQYFEYTVPGISGAVYAVYLGNSISHQSEKSNYQRYILKANLNITLEFQSSKAYIISGNSFTLTIETSEILDGETFKLYNNETFISNIDSGKTTKSINYGNYNIGHNDFYIKFEGNDDYTEMESNHLDVVVYNEIKVTPSITANPDHVMAGSNVTFTANASYIVEGENVYVPGSVTLYEDYNTQINVTTIVIGNSWVYGANSMDDASSSNPKTFYYKYDEYVDDENFIVYVNKVALQRYQVRITTLAENSITLTANSENETLDILKGLDIDLNVNLKFYGPVYNSGTYTSGILIYVDGKVYGEFNLTSDKDVIPAQISLPVGNHTVYAYYKGFNSSSDIESDLSFSQAKSNAVKVTVHEGNIVDLTVDVSNSTPKYGDTVTLTSSVSYGSLDLTNGTVQYYIGENQLSDELAIGESFKIIIDTSVEFNITAKYSGYGLYLPKEVNITVSAQKADNNPVLVVKNITYGENLNISIKNATDGIYTVTIENHEITVTVINGSGFNTSEKSNLSAKDNYTAILALDNDNYTTTGSTKFNIAKSKSVVNLPTIQNIVWGNDLKVTFSVVNRTSVTYQLNDTNSILISNGTLDGDTIEFKDLDVGKYILTVFNGENENYTSSSATENFQVMRFGSDVTINIDYLAEFNHRDINISYTGVNVTVYEITIQDEDLNVVFNQTTDETYVCPVLEGNSTGRLYWIFVENPGNETVYPSIDARSFIVFEFKSNITFSIPSDISPAQPFVIDIKLDDDAGGNLTAFIDSNEYSANIINGSAQINVSGLSDGAKTLTYRYSGDGKYESANGTFNFTVLTTPKLTGNANINMLYMDGTQYTVRAFDEYGNAAAGEYVSFTVGKKTVKVKTDKNGYASFKITYVPGSYKITATYKTASVTNTITVKQILKSKNKKVKKSAKKLVLKASLKKVKGKYLKKKVIKFKFKGKTYKAKTNKKGVAKVKIKKKVLSKLKKGKKYKVKVTYLKTSLTAKVKVR